QVASNRQLDGGAQDRASPEIDEDARSHVQDGASRVQPLLLARAVLRRGPVVQLHDAVQACSDLPFVGEIGQDDAAVPIVERVLAGMPILRRGEERRSLVEQMQYRE